MKKTTKNTERSNEKWFMRALEHYRAVCEAANEAERVRLAVLMRTCAECAKRGMMCSEATPEDLEAAMMLPGYYRHEAEQECFKRNCKAADTIVAAISAAVICLLICCEVVEVQLVPLNGPIITVCTIGVGLITEVLYAFSTARIDKRNLLRKADEIEDYIRDGEKAVPR